MKIKIINMLLSLSIFIALFFIGMDYILLKELNKLAEQSKPEVISFSLESSRNYSKKLNVYLAYANGLNNFGSFLSTENDINKRDLEIFKTYKLIKPLDSLIKNDLTGKNWKENKAKADLLLDKVAKADDGLRVEIEKSYYKTTSKEKTDYFQEYSLFVDLVKNLKFDLSCRIGSFCMCYYPSHDFIGIPSKKIVQVGDTIFVDWINYYGGHIFINETYQVKSNYDKFHLLETTYDPCNQCNKGSETILLQEYQIPFSKIKKDKKWRSVFYFRNDKLQQDSVVLERELEF